MLKTGRISFEYCNEIVELMNSAIQRGAPEVIGLHFYRYRQPEIIHFNLRTEFLLILFSCKSLNF